MIQAFTVHKKLHDCLSNQLHVDYSFEYKEGPKRECLTYPTYLMGNQALDQQAKDWFMGALEDWLRHKQHIIEAGKHTSQQAALQVCWNAYNKFLEYRITTITEQFLRGFNHFHAILPSQQNPSYQGSLHNLTELKKFCETYK